MKNSKIQGSTLVVIIIILAIAMVGLLGYVVWNNFFNNTQPSTNQSTETSKADTEPEIKLDNSYTLPDENLTFSYPTFWVAAFGYRVNEYGNDNTLELTNSEGTKISIQIPSYGPEWRFGERPFACPFDDGYVEGESFTQADLCPSFKELSSTPVKGLEGVSVYVLSRTYPEGSTATGGVDFVLAKDGCKGTDASLCERPSTKTGYYLIAETTIASKSPEQYVESDKAKQIIAILASAHY